MNDPIKIIHKYKNNNRKIQYLCYIYLGEFIPDNVKKVLLKIDNIDFFESLNTLSTNEVKSLEEYYGDYWYEKLFISHHIIRQKELITNNATRKKGLEKKFGKEWVNKHFDEYKIFRKKILYNYSTNVERFKLLRKRRKPSKKIDNLDFTTDKKTFQVGGEDQEFDSDEELDMDELGDLPSIFEEDKDENNKEGDEGENQEDEDQEEDQEEEEQQDEEQQDDFDLSELAEVYNNIDLESNKNIENTSKLITKALEDKKWEKKVEKNIMEFDEKQDNEVYDDNLSNHFRKKYIFNYYIYKDDTIKTVKNKITCSIKNNSKFGEKNYMIPSRQYLWSEYYYNDKIDKVMIGQKWVKRTELIKIDIEPNENLRVYENLRNNLKYFKDSYGSKIKREDDEYNIVDDYDDYMTANEIYLIDIYNELGLLYNPEKESKINIFNVYVQIYFPKVTIDNFDEIIQFLNNNKKGENQIIQSNYQTIMNDITLENEIIKTVEEVKPNDHLYDKFFKNNHVIQSIIHVNLINNKNITGTTNEKLNLFRIFDNFIATENYPFLQFQTPDSQLTYKYYTKSSKVDDKDILMKWFENAPYGISFKIKIDDIKYMSINLHDTGRMEYKTTWKEADKATIKDIVETYKYVRELIKKINQENTKVKIENPTDDRFKYAFINTIQQFNLPDKYTINHNDLSEFARYFFPFIALVIEPRKRQSKSGKSKDDSSKYGTYLRYKRISKYENRTRMHIRILYFMRNYEFTEKELVDEISKQFNVTNEIAIEEIDFVKTKYGNAIKKSRKILKKLKNVPKSKPPGIGIDIQGRETDKYKIRITGARNKDQLDNIVSFMKVLIYLYIETYLLKKADRQKLKEKLKELTNIARRRNKVTELVDYQSAIKNVKVVTAMDKKRIGYKPEKGQSQWTRACQNSGNDKKRRPNLIAEENISNLTKIGYVLNPENGTYERKVEIEEKGKKKKVIIRAVKLEGDENKNVYYTCNPEENKEHMYIGFLTKGNNPSGLCMPCCFKKDQFLAANKSKRDYFLKCTGFKSDSVKIEKKSLGDKLYILQDTNKVQEDRFVFLPKYLDIFFNTMLNKTKTIKNHYLLNSKTGYFFKYTIKSDKYYFLNAISTTFDLDIDTIKSKVINYLQNDKDNLMFTYLGNGDIRTQFKDKENYINFINNNNYLEIEILGDILTMPGVLTKNGVNFIVLDKKTKVIKKVLEKDKIREDYVIMCMNIENNDKYYDETRDNIIIIRDDKYYFPIFMVLKDEKKQKNISLVKTFNYDNKDSQNVINHLLKYHKLNCDRDILDGISDRSLLICKQIIKMLDQLNTIYKPILQIVDDRFKCRYIQLKNKTLISCKPSGIDYNIPITDIKNLNFKNLLNFDKTIKNLTEISKISKEQIPCKPIGVYFDRKNNDKVHVISVITSDYQSVPINGDNISLKTLKKMNFIIENKPFNDIIDLEISKGDDNFRLDDRILSVNDKNFNSEAYQLYRLELSNYLENNSELKKKIIKLIIDPKKTKKDKNFQLKKLLYKETSSKLYKILISIQKGGSVKHIVKQIGGTKNDVLVHLYNKNKQLEKYTIDNTREICKLNKDEDSCSNNPHCNWKNKNCVQAMTEEMIIEFTNKAVEELIQNELDAKEILQDENYFVSDIVDYKKFSIRDNQKIIKNTHHNINKIMSELFGKDNVPKIGRRHKNINNDTLIDQNIDNPLQEFGIYYLQKVLGNNNSIFRAYANCYYWIKNELYNIDYRNLGYNSQLQTDLSNYFKALIIDWLNDKNNQSDINKNIIDYKYAKIDSKNIYENYLVKLRKFTGNTSGFVELYVLSKIFNYPIIVFDNFNQIVYIFENGLVYYINDKKINSDKIIKNYDDYINNNKTAIILKFEFITNKTIPNAIISFYKKK